MYDSIGRNNPFDEHIPTIDMDLLSKSIGQQHQGRPIFENIAILGCGYVGGALADCWQEQVQRVCSSYGLPQVKWDPSKFSPPRKSLQVSNQKLKLAGYDLIHPQVVV